MHVNKSVRAAMILVLLALGALMSMPLRAEETAVPVQLQPAPLTPLQPGAGTPTFMVTRACCLDDWQPGNCPVGTRVFAYCTGACDVCGSFTCVSNTTFCLK
jgi:hypothetical protein